MRLLWDLESDGLLKATKKAKMVTRIHCVVAIDLDSSEEFIFRPHQIKDAIELVRSYDETVGHQVLCYDWAVLKKLHGVPRPRRGSVLDTWMWAQAAYPEIKHKDYDKARVQKLPPEFLRGPLQGGVCGSHSLKAWGLRLGEPKTEYKGGFEKFSEEMLEYCRQDVNVNLKLYRKLLAGYIPEDVARLETEVGYILDRQERHGILVDMKAATSLQAELTQEKEKIRVELSDLFPPWYVGGKITVSDKARNRRPGTRLNPMSWPIQWGGGEYQEIILTYFNPGSRAHVARCLQKHRGWKPKKRTDSGLVQVDEKVLSGLRYPEAKELMRYYLVRQRLMQLSSGKEAWLKKEQNGRIHGWVKATGAVTVRMAHSGPNTANVPKVHHDKNKQILLGEAGGWGAECRSLWLPDIGDVLVGCDASGVQMRILAHYLAQWDKGALGRVVCDPKGDIHRLFMKSTGIVDRDKQKTFTYAMILNAQPPRLAGIMGVKIPKAAAARRRLFKQIKLDELDKVLDRAHARGYLKCLDGRKTAIRSRFMALATALQAGEAVIMKCALVIADCRLQEAGFTAKAEGGKDYEFVLNVHDEWQVTCRPAIATQVATILKQAIVDAGELLKLRVPLAAEAKVGNNWMETH